MTQIGKFIVVPSYVTSASDGETHFISGPELLKLYGLKRSEAIIFEPGKMKGIKDKDFIWLYPRRNGDYRQHRERKESEFYMSGLLNTPLEPWKP